MLKKVEEYFKELLEQYPYKEPENRDSYSDYNQGWQDSLDLAMQVTKQVQLDTIQEVINTCMEEIKLEITSPYSKRIETSIIREFSNNIESKTIQISKDSITRILDKLNKKINEKS